MRILILGLNYAPEAIGIGPYTTGLCEHLAAEGHELRVIAAKPYYPKWQIFKGYRGLWSRRHENGVEVLRCPIYVTSRPTGLRRLVHHASFAISALVPMILSAVSFRPDLILTIAPSLVAAPLAGLAARITGAKSWLHVQDFEVEAAFATGLLNEAGPAIRFIRGIERKIISSYDELSSISPEMCRKLQSFGIPAERVTEFRNWAEIDAIQPLERPSSYRAEWNIATPHVALYSGNIGNKQGIEILVETAKHLRHRDDLTFVICGQGPNRAKLEAIASGLSNVRFFDLQPKEQLGEMLGLATIHLLPQKADAADLVLPSKLTNMLASGRPVIVTAAPGTGLAREVNGCGIAVPPGDAPRLAEAIERLLDRPGEWSRFAASARERAEIVWSRETILAGIARRIEERVQPRKARRFDSSRRETSLRPANSTDRNGGQDRSI